MTATQIQFRRGSAAQMATFTGAVGEVVVDTTNNRVVVHDGATAGGFAAAKLSEVPSNASFNVPYNLQLNASVAGNLLTVAIKAADTGNDPTASHPVVLPFRDATLGNGDPVAVSITSALSISTNAAGASLGTAANVPFRFWVVAFNNGGAVVLALINCLVGGAAPTHIVPLDAWNVQSTTAIGGSATSAGVFYTPNGVALTGKAFCILGYVEYVNGLGTPGTYTAAPDKVQLFGPGIKRPGDTVQSVIGSTQTSASANSSTFVDTNLTASITPTSPANPIRIAGTQQEIYNGGAGSFGTLRLRRGSTTIYTPSTVAGFNNAGAAIVPFGFGPFWDAPGTTASTTYKTQIAQGGTGTVIVQNNGGMSLMQLDEMMA